MQPAQVERYKHQPILHYHLNFKSTTMRNKKIVNEMIQMNKNIMNTLNSNMESLVNLIEDEEGNFL